MKPVPLRPDGSCALGEEGPRSPCPLCGYRFHHDDAVCGGCALAAGCRLVRCPHCGYAFPASSRLADWLLRGLRAIAGRRPRPPSGRLES